MVKINVISILDSKRYRQVKLRLARLGFKINISHAIDLREKTLGSLYDVFDVKSFEARYGRSPSSGEVGCVLSHLKAIKELNSKSIHGGVIFEDDVLPLRDASIFQKIYEDIAVSSFDIVVLGYSKTDNNTENYINLMNPLLPVFHTEESYVIGPRYQDTTSGAVGYVVNQKAVAVISDMSFSSHLADDWAYYASIGLSIGYVSPMLVREDILECRSTLGHDSGFIAPKNSKYLFIRMLLKMRRATIGYYRLQIMKLKYCVSQRRIGCHKSQKYSDLN